MGIIYQKFQKFKFEKKKNRVLVVCVHPLGLFLIFQVFIRTKHGRFRFIQNFFLLSHEMFFLLNSSLLEERKDQRKVSRTEPSGCLHYFKTKKRGKFVVWWEGSVLIRICRGEGGNVVCFTEESVLLRLYTFFPIFSHFFFFLPKLYFVYFSKVQQLFKLPFFKFFLLQGD